MSRFARVLTFVLASLAAAGCAAFGGPIQVQVPAPADADVDATMTCITGGLNTHFYQVTRADREIGLVIGLKNTGGWSHEDRRIEVTVFVDPTTGGTVIRGVAAKVVNESMKPPSDEGREEFESIVEVCGENLPPGKPDLVG